MFDANARYLPKGTRFFAHVYGLKENSPLTKIGVWKDDIVLCEMLEETSHNPMIRAFSPEHGHVDFRDCSGALFQHLAVFAGMEDLTSFIDDEHLAKAKQVLEKMK